ncbi:MAG: hypothetical protein U1E56_03025 [Bauldia sp.]
MSADLDVYVEHVGNFQRARGYTLTYLIDDLRGRGARVIVRDRFDGSNLGRAALVHVDLTDVPSEFRPIADHYPLAINGRALSIRRTLYSAARITADSSWSGPVIVKTVLNAGGRPERRYRRAHSVSARLIHAARKFVPRLGVAPPHPYQVFASIAEVPAAIWSEESLIVERFLPGSLDLPIVKYRFLFCLEAEVTLRGTFDDLFCRGKFILDHGTVSEGPPAEVRAIRERLQVDFGAIDYFIVDGVATVVDVNKTVGTSQAWWQRYPFMRAYVGRAGAALAARVC